MNGDVTNSAILKGRAMSNTTMTSRQANTRPNVRRRVGSDATSGGALELGTSAVDVNTMNRNRMEFGAMNGGAMGFDSVNGSVMGFGTMNNDAMDLDTMNSITPNGDAVANVTMNNNAIYGGEMFGSVTNSNAVGIGTAKGGGMNAGIMNADGISADVINTGVMNAGTMDPAAVDGGAMHGSVINSHAINPDTAAAVAGIAGPNNISEVRGSSEAHMSNTVGRKSFSRWNNERKSSRTSAPGMEPKISHGESQIVSKGFPVSSTASLPPRPPYGTGNNSAGPNSPSDTMPKLSPIDSTRPPSPRKQGSDAKISKQAQAGPPKRKRKLTSPKDSFVSNKPSLPPESEASVEANGGVRSRESKGQKARRKPSGPSANSTLWYDLLVKAWPILTNESPQEEYFSLEKILITVEKNWVSLRGKNPPKNHRWKGNILRTLQAQADCRPAAQSTDLVQRNTHMSDLYRLSDTYKPPHTPGRSGSLSTNNVSSQNNECTGSTSETKDQKASSADGNTLATVPREFTLEAMKPIHLSEVDKARMISFVGPPTSDTVKGFKGFRTIRASAGVFEGDWYFEVRILTDASEGAARLGWSLRRSDLETPVGFDGHGFAIRDLSGEFVHRSLRTAYGAPFGKNDVIGCRIQLPSLTEKEKKIVHIAEKRFLEYRFVKLLQGAAPPGSQLDIYSRAKVMFYKNGKCLGVPSFFTDKSSNGASKTTSNSDSGSQKSERNELLKLNGYQKRVEEAKKREMKAGVYYPAISLFGDAVACANFGPEFKFGLPEGSKPMCEAVAPAVGVKSGGKRHKVEKDEGLIKVIVKEESARDEDSDSGDEDRDLRDSMDVEEAEDNAKGPPSVQNNLDTEIGSSRS